MPRVLQAWAACTSRFRFRLHGTGSLACRHKQIIRVLTSSVGLVLAEILEGMDVMRNGSDRSQGALRAASALDAYGRHFNHPNWVTIAR